MDKLLSWYIQIANFMKHRQALDVGHAQRVNLRELYEEIRDNVDIKIESKLHWILDTETHFNAPTPPVVNPLSAPTRRITVEYERFCRR